MSLEEILKKIDDSRDDIVRDMMDMIRIPSIGPANGGEGERKRADYLMTLLNGYDEVKRIDVDDADYPGVQRPSILAVKKGKRKGTVWIVAHTDTVLPGDLTLWKYPPFDPHIEDGKIYGLGAEDNGQAVISAIYASRFFDMELNGRSMGIALVADEETTSEMGIGWLVKNGYFSKDDIILVPDWGSPGSSMVDIAEKHLLWVKISVKGKQTHGSTPELGLNAYRVGAKFMTDLLKELEERYPERNDIFYPPVSTFEPTKNSVTVGNVNTIPVTTNSGWTAAY
jgi:succinyl-diaminopimelate desuccinylase